MSLVGIPVVHDREDVKLLLFLAVTLAAWQVLPTSIRLWAIARTGAAILVGMVANGGVGQIGLLLLAGAFSAVAVRRTRQVAGAPEMGA